MAQVFVDLIKPADIKWSWAEAKLKSNWSQTEVELKPNWSRAEVKLKSSWSQTEAELKPSWSRAKPNSNRANKQSETDLNGRLEEGNHVTYVMYGNALLCVWPSWCRPISTVRLHFLESHYTVLIKYRFVGSCNGGYVVVRAKCKKQLSYDLMLSA